LKTKDTVRNLY